MTHSLNKIWVHAILNTKYKLDLIESLAEERIHSKIKTELIECGCYVEAINGVEDHIHVLFILNKQKAVADIIKQVKGATSFWVNDKKLTKQKFMWQTGYSVYSVSEQNVEMVKKYIEKQKEHHSGRS